MKCVEKEVVSTYGLVLCNTDRQTNDLSPCTHEEADIRLLLHVADCAKRGHTGIMLPTVSRHCHNNCCFIMWLLVNSTYQPTGPTELEKKIIRQIEVIRPFSYFSFYE